MRNIIGTWLMVAAYPQIKFGVVWRPAAFWLLLLCVSHTHTQYIRIQFSKFVAVAHWSLPKTTHTRASNTLLLPKTLKLNYIEFGSHISAPYCPYLIGPIRYILCSSSASYANRSECHLLRCAQMEKASSHGTYSTKWYSSEVDVRGSSLCSAYARMAYN